MKALLLSRVTAVWALLIIATTLSWQLGHGAGFDDTRQAGAAILVVTFIKVRLVMRDFMEIRHAPRWMKLIGDAWIVLITVLLVGLFLKTGT